MSARQQDRNTTEPWRVNSQNSCEMWGIISVSVLQMAPKHGEVVEMVGFDSGWENRNGSNFLLLDFRTSFLPPLPLVRKIRPCVRSKFCLSILSDTLWVSGKGGQGQAFTELEPQSGCWPVNGLDYNQETSEKLVSLAPLSFLLLLPQAKRKLLAVLGEITSLSAME